MKVSDLLQRRRPCWDELDRLCTQMAGASGLSARRVPASTVARFSTLYRAACADLALADAYQLPPDVIEYLQRLVARAHSQLYRSRSFNMKSWLHTMFVDVPGRLIVDPCLWLALILFWGVFFGSACLAYVSPDFVDAVLGQEQTSMLQEMYDQPIGEDRGDAASTYMFGFYIMNNVSIGFRCFVFGIIMGVGGIIITVSNAAILGASFGFMATTPQSGNFFHFVTAHWPFELTAICVAAGAGMRLGFSIINTRGMTRMASLHQAGQVAMPAVMLAATLFGIAALIEGYVSPSSLPYGVKLGVAIVSTLLLIFYFFGLGIMARMAAAPETDQEHPEEQPATT